MRPRVVAALAAACFGIAPSASGEVPELCTNPLTAATVIRCALARSPEVRRARLDLDVVAAQRMTARTLLPQRPVLSVSAGQRWAAGATAFDAYVALSQEMEVGGQRSLRLDEVDAASAAAIRRIHATEHEVAAAAVAAYWRYVAARQRVVLSREAADIATALGRLTEERRKEALVAPVDADIAESEAVQIGLRAGEADRAFAEASAELAALLDLGDPAALQPGEETDPAPAEPPPGLVNRALVMRADLAAAQAEKTAADRRIAVLERERIPNVTLSVSWQRDGFAENFIGGGLSIPIPLPAPLVPNGAGEIAAARARSVQADLDVVALRRRVTVEVNRAVANQRTAASAVRAFSGALIERARKDLEALGEALTARQMSVREALLAQRSLLDLLESHLEVRLQYRLARTELWRAAGLPLSPDGTP
jgi:cobalt-zinc-cadmium efflux system outer membrane protein